MRCPLVLLLLASGALAQMPPQPQPHLIHASGDATVQASPNHAQMRLSVVTEAPTAQAAAAANARRTEEVLRSVKPLVPAGTGQVSTSGFSVIPQYRYPSNGKASLTGYRATNAVIVETDHIDSAGKLLDAAVGSGANDVGNLTFSVKDDSALYRQAIGKAAESARANAEAAAKALGLQVTAVADVQVESPEPLQPRPLQARMAVAQSEGVPSTPVETGTLAVRAHVTVALQVQ